MNVGIPLYTFEHVGTISFVKANTVVQRRNDIKDVCCDGLCDKWIIFVQNILLVDLPCNLSISFWSTFFLIDFEFTIYKDGHEIKPTTGWQQQSPREHHAPQQHKHKSSRAFRIQASSQQSEWYHKFWIYESNEKAIKTWFWRGGGGGGWYGEIFLLVVIIVIIVLLGRARQTAEAAEASSQQSEWFHKFWIFESNEKAIKTWFWGGRGGGRWYGKLLLLLLLLGRTRQTAEECAHATDSVQNQRRCAPSFNEIFSSGWSKKHSVRQ